MAISVFLGVKFRNEISSFASFAIKKIKEIGGAAMASGAVSTDLTSFQAGLATLGPYAGIIAGVTAALVVGVAAWDAYQTSVSEWSSKIQETEGKITSLKTEIENLQAIDFRTQDEQERLDLLQSELDYQERLLEVEKKRIAQQKYGYNSYAEAWDKDNANNILREDEMKRGRAGIGTVRDASLLPRGYDSAVVLQAAIDIESYDQKLKTLNKDSEEYAKTLEEKEKAELKSSDSLEQLYIDTADYQQKVNEAEEAQEKLVEGSDAWTNAENLINTYKEWIAENEEAIERFQKATGTFDYGKIINSTLQHSEFEGLKDNLIGLAKDGSLSVDVLTTRFADLVEMLEVAGVDANMLYQYILRLAGLVDTENLSTKIAGQLGKKSYDSRGFEVNQAAILKEYFDSLPEEDRQIIAGLDIDWSTFNADEAIKLMQKKIDQSHETPVKVETEPTIADSVVDINTKLKSQFDELGNLYNKIFNGDKGFDLSEIDNADLKGIVDSFAQFSEELGLTADEQEHVKESAEDFMKVLTNEKSTSEQVQQAFNDLATTYFYDADGLKELNTQTANAIEQQLEQMGVVNAHEVVQEQLNAQLEVQENKAEALAAATSDMTGETQDASAEFWREANMSNLAKVQLADLVAQEKIFNNTDLDASQKIQALKELASQAMGAAAALEFERLVNDVDGAGLSMADAWDQVVNKFAKLPPLTIEMPDTSAAGGAGKDAGDAYVEAFEKELEALEKQRDAGLISESQFLDKYRELIEKYFKDVDGYGEEYAERMADYWDRLISHMESVVSAIGTLLDKRKEAAEQGKEVAIKALEEEQKAAESNYQSQIDYIDGLIDALEDEKDALQDQIDVLNDQIDAINDANTAREHSMALQKAQYELERSMSQRTKLVYTGEVGQMRYERDESAVRSAQEGVNDAEDQLAIDAIEKQIKLLEEQQELIDKQIQSYQEQQDALQDMLDKSNEYYESLIEQTETYWDTLIEAIDNQKSKWDELVEQKEIAEAFALVQDAMRSLGFTVEDVLNDTPGAFEAFRDAYLNALSDANSNNQDFIDGLQYATNSAKGAFGEISSSAGEIENALGKVAEATTPLAAASENITAVGTAASNASSGMGALKTATDGIAEDVNKLNTTSFDGLTKALKDVKGKIEKISEALVGSEGSIESALQKLNDENALANLDKAFKALSDSITSVAGLLGAGGGVGGGEDTDASSESMGGDAREGSSEGSGLASAIQKIQEAANTYIGESADDTGDNTIGRFNLLKSAIQTLVDEVIGNTEIEGTLIGSIKSLPQITDEALSGDEGAIAKFDLLSASLEACAKAAAELLGHIQGLSGLTLPSFEGGEGAIPTFTGTAKYTGDWSVGKNEKALVGELGPEVVLRDGKYTVVGQNGPEFVRLRKDDIVLNHLQSQAVLDKKNQIRALADGTVLSPIGASETSEKLKGLVNGMLPSVGNIREIINNQTKEIQRTIEGISKVSTNPNITITSPSFTVSGVTGEEVMRKIEGSFEGLMLNAYQKAMS